MAFAVQTSELLIATLVTVAYIAIVFSQAELSVCKLVSSETMRNIHRLFLFCEDIGNIPSFDHAVCPVFVILLHIRVT